MSTTNNEITPAIPGEWVRAPKPGETLFGLKRATIYQLCAAEKIRWTVIKHDPSAKRGVRLIHRPSLLSFIEQSEREQRGDFQSEASSKLK